VAFTGAKQARNLAARQFAAVEDCLQDPPGFLGQCTGTNLYLDPVEDACPQSVRLKQPFHEFNLIETVLQKESAKIGQGLFAEGASTVKIITAGEIALGQMVFILGNLSRQAAGNGPDTASVKDLKQYSMGHQSRHPPIAVEKRVYPEQAVMSCGRRDNRFCRAQTTVGARKMVKKTGKRAGADRYVSPDLDVLPAQCSRNHPHPFASLLIVDEEQLVREKFAKTSMDFAECIAADGAAAQAAGVYPLLNGDMRPGFALQIALFGVRAVLVSQGPFDLYRMGVVAFDEVAVVAVHCSNQIGQGLENPDREASAESGRLCRQLHGQIGKALPMS